MLLSSEIFYLNRITKIKYHKTYVSCLCLIISANSVLPIGTSECDSSGITGESLIFKNIVSEMLIKINCHQILIIS